MLAHQPRSRAPAARLHVLALLPAAGEAWELLLLPELHLARPEHAWRAPPLRLLLPTDPAAVLKDVGGLLEAAGVGPSGAVRVDVRGVREMAITTQEVAGARGQEALWAAAGRRGAWELPVLAFADSIWALAGVAGALPPDQLTITSWTLCTPSQLVCVAWDAGRPVLWQPPGSGPSVERGCWRYFARQCSVLRRCTGAPPTWDAWLEQGWGAAARQGEAEDPDTLSMALASTRVACSASAEESRCSVSSREGAGKGGGDGDGGSDGSSGSDGGSMPLLSDTDDDLR